MSGWSLASAVMPFLARAETYWGVLTLFLMQAGDTVDDRDAVAGLHGGSRGPGRSGVVRRVVRPLQLCLGLWPAGWTGRGWRAVRTPRPDPHAVDLAARRPHDCRLVRRRGTSGTGERRSLQSIHRRTHHESHRVSLPCSPCRVCAGAGSSRADVRTEEKTQVRFEGGVGKVINFFAGKAAREGVKIVRRRNGHSQSRCSLTPTAPSWT